MAQVKKHKIPNSALLYTLISQIDLLVILPLIPLLVENQNILNIGTEVASILSIRLVFSLIGSFASPVILKNYSFGVQLMIIAILKTLSFICLLDFSLTSVYLFSILTGTGTGIFKPLVRSLITESTDEKQRKIYFQIYFIVLNAAYIAGPLIVEQIEKRGVSYIIFLILAIIELSISLFFYKTIRSLESSTKGIIKQYGKKEKLNFSYFRKDLLLNYAYGFFTSLAIGFMISMFILYKEVNPVLGSFKNFFLSYEGFAMIIMQILILPFFSKMSHKLIFSLASLLVVVGIFLSFSHDWWLIIIGLTIFAASESLFMPQAQISLSLVAKKKENRIAFGVFSVICALGEILGNYLTGIITSLPNINSLAYAKGLGLILGILLLIIGLQINKTFFVSKSKEQNTTP